MCIAVTNNYSDIIETHLKSVQQWIVMITSNTTTQKMPTDIVWTAQTDELSAMAHTLSTTSNMFYSKEKTSLLAVRHWLSGQDTPYDISKVSLLMQKRHNDIS